MLQCIPPALFSNVPISEGQTRHFPEPRFWPATVPVVFTLVRRIFLVIASQPGKRWEWWRKGLGAIPFATVGRMQFFKLGVGQSTVMRVPAVLPVTSAMGLPTPTLTKLAGQSLKSKVPL